MYLVAPADAVLAESGDAFKFGENVTGPADEKDLPPECELLHAASLRCAVSCLCGHR